MSSREKAPETPQAGEAEQKHDRILLRALQIAHPVIYQGQQRFIHTLTCQISGGSTETTVYLTGDPTPVKPSDVQLQEQPT